MPRPSPLHAPLHRTSLPWQLHAEFRRPPPVQGCIHDVRRQQRQHEDTPEVAAGQFHRCRQVADRFLATVVVHPLPPVHPHQRLD